MLQHALEGEQPARDPLGVVQPVHTQEDPHAAVAPDGVDFAVHRRIAGHHGERRGVHAHREHAQPNLPTGHLHPVDLDRVAQDVGQRCREVPEIRRCMEADQVGAEHALQQPVARGQRAEQLLGRKRDVEEEPDPGSGQAFAQEAGEQEELVVVNPDHVAGPVVRGDHVGEGLVGLHVAVPMADLERDLIQ